MSELFLNCVSTWHSTYKSIIPIEELNKYFRVKATLRRKRSGTRNVSKKDFINCEIEAMKHFNNLGVEIESITFNDKKAKVTLKNNNINRLNQYFGKSYFLSEIEEKNSYYIKTRSNTNNLNVIFSLNYIGPKENLGIELLQKFMLSNIQ